ncbi:MAG: hypothetical protein KatS3mg021_0939 [Fimbriimonadales bacterium]|nr:MAG: hypothetical protein KatS3mg021_0939 [Fimbriimonadales bacterium]
MLVRLYDAETGALIGTLNEVQFRALQEAFEEESAEDQDYYIHRDALHLIQDDTVVALLTQALGDRGEMDIRWEMVSG